MKRAERGEPKNKVRLMLDSGAFSAWTNGTTLDLGEYIAYIKAHAHLIDTYFNLDVIPGRKGQKRNPKMVEEAARQSHVNLVKMKRAGLKPIPVFHQDESFKWLELMLKDGEDYIALATYKELDSGEWEEWLDKCFTMVTDSDGRAIVKVHGLGVASFDLLRRYPWETCDATSWALTAAFGSIYCPVYSAGQPDYTRTPIKIGVSNFDRKSGKTPPDHILRYGPIMRERVDDFLEKHVHTTLEAVSGEDYVERARAIVYFLMRFQEAIGEVRFKARGTFFL